MTDRIDFQTVNRVAMARLPELLARWLPGGRRAGIEYVVRNPTRLDRRLGSFRINLQTGVWADFATGDRGGDPIALLAYITGSSQLQAARALSLQLGISRCPTDRA